VIHPPELKLARLELKGADSSAEASGVLGQP